MVHADLGLSLHFRLSFPNQVRGQTTLLWMLLNPLESWL